MLLIKPKAPVFLSFFRNASCQLSTINGISHFVTSLLRGKYKCQTEIENNKLSRLFFSQIYIIMFIILILLRIVCSKEDSGINKRLHQKAFFRRNFSCRAPHSVMYLLEYPFPTMINLSTWCLSRTVIQLHEKEMQELFCFNNCIQVLSASFPIYLPIKSIHLTLSI